MIVHLRPYQEESVKSLRAAVKAGHKRIILYAPTGSGKTEVAIDMIRRATNLGKKVAFVCNRIELVGQASRRLDFSDIPHGIVQGKNTLVAHDDNVVVCSIQTLARRGFPDCDFVIVDEAHGTPSSRAYKKLFKEYDDLVHIGLTATPFTKGLGKQWQKLVSSTTIQKLIDQGYLVDVQIYAPGEPDLSKVRTVAGDYHEGDLGKAVDKRSLVGDIVDHWFRLGNQRSTVVFATNIAHSLHITEQFQGKGVAAEHIDCYTRESDRSDILGRVKAGTTKVISNVGILQEGWDFPACEVMILARPTKSLTRYIQMAGRILRPFPGKKGALILDHSGTCKLLGYPTDDFELSLDTGRPLTAANALKSKSKLPHMCPTCSFMKPSGVFKCPKCGFTPEKVNTIDTDDQELELLKRNKNKADKKKVYAELIGYAIQKGYKKGWAYHKIKSLYGHGCREEPVPTAPSPETLRLIQHLNIRYAKRKEKS